MLHTLLLKMPKPTFEFEHALRPGLGTTVATYQPGEVIFGQGDAADSVIYLREGVVKLSVLSRRGKEAVVAMLQAGAFFGETALRGDPVRHTMAIAMTVTSVVVIAKRQMLSLLRDEQAFSDYFLSYMLARNARVEADVVAQLFNTSEERLARALLLMAGYGTKEGTHCVLPNLTQETLAEMVGTTRSRVNFFMKKFKRLGYIDYGNGLKVNDSLVTVMLRERAPMTRSKTAWSPTGEQVPPCPELAQESYVPGFSAPPAAMVRTPGL